MSGGEKDKQVIFTATTGGGRASDWEDVEALRGVLKAISDFLRDVREPLKGLMDFVLGSVDGERVGSDVAKFYSKLRESGVPEELAVQLTRDYFRARVESVNLPSLMREFMGRFGGRLGPRPQSVGGEEGRGKEERGEE